MQPPRRASAPCPWLLRLYSLGTKRTLKVFVIDIYLSRNCSSVGYIYLNRKGSNTRYRVQSRRRRFFEVEQKAQIFQNPSIKEYALTHNDDP